MTAPAPPFQVDPADPWYRSDLWAQVSELSPGLIATDEDKLAALEALEYASFVLHALSGRRYSPARTITEIYDTRITLGYGAEPYPVLINGSVYNVCNGCVECCCNVCGIFHRTRLRGQPIRSVDGVWVDGVQLLPSNYLVLDNSVLGFTQVEVCNAHCLVVTYTYGSGIPPGGRLAVLKLATELLNYSRGGECELPARVTSVSRQGLTWTLLDPQEFLKDGRTGVYLIDLFLRAANPGGALAPAKVFSPDLPRASMVTFAAPPSSYPLPDAPGLFVPSYQRVLGMSRYTPLLDSLAALTPLDTAIDGVLTIDQDWTIDTGLASLDLDPLEQRRLTAASTVLVSQTGAPDVVVMSGPVTFL
jgi:hypothetical protein